MHIMKFATLIIFGYFLAVMLMVSENKKFKIGGLVLMISITLVMLKFGYLELQIIALRGGI